VSHTRHEGAAPIEPKNEDLSVYIAEGDEQAVATDIRRMRVVILIVVLALVGAISLVALINRLEGRDLPPAFTLQFLGILLAIAAVVAYVVLPRVIKKRRVWVGADFIEIEGTPPSGYASMARFHDIVAVRIDMSAGHIVGATIVAKGGPVLIRRVKTPAIVIRAIFDLAPEHVKWRRTWLPLTRLSRDNVRQMLDQADTPPLDTLLPPGETYTGADEWFSQDKQAEPRPGPKGWWDRLTGAKIYKRTFASTELPTPASLYVNFMLLQMFEDGATTRLLKRSQPLPTLTRDSQTAAPPPLDDIVSRLQHMCNIDPNHSPAPVDGTIDMVFEGSSGQPQPCKLHCRFDDTADTRCEIHLEIPQS
jgi:hypothetical protein